MLKFALHTERGGGHAESEDYLLRESHPSDGGRFLCFLADGQGGRADGAAAARIACEAALDGARGFSWEDLTRQTTWDEVFMVADRKVAEKCDGCTTLIGIAIDENAISGGSAGDSKAYLYEESNGFVELTEGQRKNPPIGGGCDAAYAFRVPEFRGSLLAVSDGVWKYAGYDALKHAAEGPIERVVDRLRAETLSRQGGRLPDDFTVIAATNCG